MLSVETIGVALIGYILGSIPFGVLVAKRKGVDIFSVGSGNPGATNVLRTIGKPAGYLVFFLDFLKGLIATTWFLFPWISFSGDISWVCGGCQVLFLDIHTLYLLDLEEVKEWQPQWGACSELCRDV